MQGLEDFSADPLGSLAVQEKQETHEQLSQNVKPVAGHPVNISIKELSNWVKVHLVVIVCRGLCVDIGYLNSLLRKVLESHWNIYKSSFLHLAEACKVQILTIINKNKRNIAFLAYWILKKILSNPYIWQNVKNF